MLSDRAQRDLAGTAFFGDDRSAIDRNTIASHWDATFVVVEPTDLVDYPWLIRDYPLVDVTHAYVVFRLSRFPREP